MAKLALGWGTYCLVAGYAIRLVAKMTAASETQPLKPGWYAVTVLLLVVGVILGIIVFDAACRQRPNTCTPTEHMTLTVAVSVEMGSLVTALWWMVLSS